VRLSDPHSSHFWVFFMSHTNPSVPGAAVAEYPSVGSLAVRDTAVAPYQPQPQMLPQPPAAEEQGEGGLDILRILHSFRRRWLPAVVLGTVVGLCASVGTYLFAPRGGYEAVVWLRVRNKSDVMAFGGRDSGEYDMYRRTQMQLLKSPFVINSALRSPGIAELRSLREERDPASWLSSSLQVFTPADSEVMQLKLMASTPEDAIKILNAVTAVYLDNIVNKDRTERLSKRDMLEKKFKENQAELRSRREVFNELAKTLGTRDSSEVSTQRSLLLDHLQTLRSQVVRNQQDIRAIDTELSVLELEKTLTDDAIRESLEKEGETAGERIDQAVDAALFRDPQIAEMMKRYSEINSAISVQESRSVRGSNEPVVKRMRAQREELIAMMEDRKKMLRKLAVGQGGLQPGNGGAEGRRAVNPAVLKLRRDTLARSLEEASEEFDRVAKEVANADIENRRAEIDQLARVTDQIGLQLESSSIDITSPARVNLVEEASVPGGDTRKKRILLAAMAGAAGMGLGGAIVVLLEYMTNKLNVPDEMSKRGGLRLIGSMPRLSRSRKRTGNSQLVESIDSIRTFVLQSGREPPKVILVTSPGEHEGKTTFAAQLAASLARADKRTLLLDGDLRHPTVHLSLQVEAGPGFAELLRGEMKPDEVIQPTSIERLFVVAGGAADEAAVNALARPELANAIKSFRNSFDIVVIDSGAVSMFVDALLIGQQSDVAIVSSMIDVSRIHQIVSAADRLRSAGVRILGGVVNGATSAPAGRQTISRRAV
jgi:capsular exopolysaccharide synthesis family protein